MLMNTLNPAVHGLGEIEMLVAVLKELGRRHLD